MALFSGTQLTCVRGERTVFHGLDFHVDAGGLLLLTGPNGSGKSSLLRLMCGLLEPTMGEIIWNNENTQIERDDHNARLHYVGHHDAIKPMLSVAENISFWAEMHNNNGGGKQAVKQRVKSALERLGIAHLSDVPARYLSAGQTRRCALARILASPATLWLLDEPTTALDVETIATLETIIADHRKDGGIAIISTHSHIRATDPQTLDLGPFMGQPYANNMDEDAA